ncbi:hypothetical protein KR093_002941 [Drosophila rubida]|uniref:MADF domain-containing protein n=1 Tax=Drosophila rubida TaxID=30044 RepID=A0AAD4PN23_9MUSC|nr:hypothetical protein KR093_002941 [Drosophila rubida]
MKLDNYRLIVEVGRRRALWDSTMHLSQRKDVGSFLWDEVASIMQADVNTCKKRFKGLRDSYRAEVRKIQRRRIDYSNWPYFRPLEFLRNIFDPDQLVPFAPLPFNIESDCNDSGDQQKLDDFVIDVDNDSFDFEIMGDIFKRDTSNTPGPDSGSDLSTIVKQNNVDMFTPISYNNRSDVDISPLPKAPSTKRMRRHKSSTPTSEQSGFVNGCTSTPPPSQKSTTAVAAGDSTKDDADHNFLVSLLPHMKTLSTLNNMKFRTEVSRLLMELNQQDMQRESISQQHHHQSSPNLPKLTPAPASTNLGYHQQHSNNNTPNSKYSGSSTHTNSSPYAAHCSIIECDVKIENEPLF